MPAPTVLIARGDDRATPLIVLLREAGIEAVAAPVIERAPVIDAGQRAELARARASLSRGDYAWVAVTSVNAVDALLGPAPVERSATRWACVGPATRRSIEAHGLVADIVPARRMTAAGLVESFPATGSATRSPDAGPATGSALGSAAAPAAGDPDALAASSTRVLVPLGDLAAPTLPDGLRAKGWAPDVVVAYRTVSRALPPGVVGHARTAGYDVVVVASGSAAREIAAQLGPQRVVAIGEPSAAAARRAGHDVAAVAARPTDEALASAVADAVTRTNASTDSKERS
ncbi:uroporphyrinogen-III synthase [Myceligenerans crystallogenes]|uniref:Uroporphyrinogen-III synthase n=1 Tax=Myceligenerans crystallogenes TaxID=316335 RepID=A0ABN2NF90_9MICO